MDEDEILDRISSLEGELSELRDLTLNMGKALALALGEIAETSGGSSFSGIGVGPLTPGHEEIYSVHEAYMRGRENGKNDKI